MPQIAIAAVRPTKLAKFLFKSNHNVDLLTTSENIDAAHLRNVYTMPAQTTFLRKNLDKVLEKRRNNSTYSSEQSIIGKKNKIKTIIKKCLYKVITYLSFIAELGCSQKQFKYFKKNIERCIDFNQYDVVFSTFSPLFTHYIARRIKKRKKELIWVADFRDPLLGAAVPRIFKSRCKCIVENITCKADLVTMVSNDGRAAYQFSKKANVKVLSNGFDREDYNFARTPLDENLNLCYAGSFYNGRESLLRVFQAIKNLTSSGKIDKNKIKIHYFGKQAHYCYEWANKTGLNEQLNIHGIVSKEESIKFSMQCDINLVSVWNNKTSQGIISGKIYELFAMGKPIIAEITGNVPESELKRMIEATETGYCYEEAVYRGNVKGIEEYILQIYNDKMQGKTLNVGNQSQIENYNYRNITEKLVANIKEYEQNKD